MGLIRIHYKTRYALVLFMVFAVLCHLSIRMIGISAIYLDKDDDDDRTVLAMVTFVMMNSYWVLIDIISYLV